MIHNNPHPLAGETVLVLTGQYAGEQYRIEDWYDRVVGESWKSISTRAVAFDYASRGAKDGLPIDDEVLYGKIGPFGKLIHVTELGS